MLVKGLIMPSIRPFDQIGYSSHPEDEGNDVDSILSAVSTSELDKLKNLDLSIAEVSQEIEGLREQYGQRNKLNIVGKRRDVKQVKRQEIFRDSLAAKKMHLEAKIIHMLEHFDVDVENLDEVLATVSQLKKERRKIAKNPGKAFRRAFSEATE
ncbi:MAG: hypothetical protein ACI8RA_002649 [Chlamydiales bacterium]